MHYFSLHILLGRAESRHQHLFIHPVKKYTVVLHFVQKSWKHSVHSSASAQLKLLASKTIGGRNPTLESEMLLLLSFLLYKIDDHFFPPECWQSVYLYSANFFIQQVGP